MFHVVAVVPIFSFIHTCTFSGFRITFSFLALDHLRMTAR